MFLSPSGGILSCRWFRAQLGRGGSSTCCKSWFEGTIAAAERQPCTMVRRNASSEATLQTNFLLTARKSSRRSLTWHQKWSVPVGQTKKPFAILLCGEAREACCVRESHPLCFISSNSTFASWNVSLRFYITRKWILPLRTLVSNYQLHKLCIHKVSTG